MTVFVSIRCRLQSPYSVGKGLKNTMEKYWHMEKLYIYLGHRITNLIVVNGLNMVSLGLADYKGMVITSVLRTVQS